MFSPAFKKNYRRLLQYVKPYWFVFIIGLIGGISYSGVDALTIKLLKPLIDEGFVNKNKTVIAYIPLVVPILFLLRGLMGFTANYSMKWVGRKIIMQIRQQIFAHLQSLPATFYDHATSGQLLAKIIYNVEQVAKACTDVITDIVRELCLIGFLLTVMLLTNWRLTLIFLGVGPLVVGLFHFVSKRFRKVSHQIQDMMGEVTHVAEENIEGYKVVRLFGGQEYEQKQFKKVTEKQRKLEMKSILIDTISVPLIQFVGGCALAGTILVAITFPHLSLSAGAFASLVTAMISLLKPLKSLSSVNSAIQRGMAGAESIFAILDEKPETNEGVKTLERAQGYVVFDRVNFNYAGKDKQVLTNVSFSADKGQSIALVGHSGSGKTTLVNLLLRFYDNYTGNIYLDNININDLPLKTLRQQFAMVTQQVVLFNDTIANNIAYGEADKNPEKLRHALKAANADDFIAQLPDGVHTMVGENGVLLSGGQRQRLAIARAIYKDAPLLILDEATSALDTQSEKQIQLALETLKQNRTTFIIAHRLSTIENADKIIVLKEGKIQAMGSHQTLLTHSLDYKLLHQHAAMQTES